MIKLSLGAEMCGEKELRSSRLIWELSAVLKCQGTQNNETGFVGITHLYGHIYIYIYIYVPVCVSAYFRMDTSATLCILI